MNDTYPLGVGPAPAGKDDEFLPPHAQDCLGCGPGNPHGHHLQARRSGEGVDAQHVFDKRHVGAPGIAHGGAVATVVDDLFGFLLYVVGELAVTRNLNVEYLAPVRLGVPYQCQAELAQRERRKLFMNARITDQEGSLVVTARALFLTVDIAHFGDEGAATFDMLRIR